ncbi:MAG: outer membrane protein transport protein [Pseudomonadota bacterium]
MTKLMTSVAALTAMTAAASAGGIERAANGYGILFEDGNRLEIGFSTVDPNVKGDYPAGLGGGSTGNMAVGYSNLSLSYKHDFSDKFALALFLNQPYGADASYTQGAYTGLAATWDSDALSLVGRYRFTDNISVYGGLRVVRSSADIAIPAVLVTAPYTAVGDDDTQTGAIVGAAYELPDIALRVALTYEAGFTHSFDTVENWAVAMATNAQGVTEVEIPDAITLDFQTGIAEDTLLFGKIKHTEWSVWEVAPPVYEMITGGAVTGLDNDVTTYQLGIGRRFSENFSGSIRVTYEKSNGGVASRLAPTDGSTGIGIGGRYTMDNVTLSGGLEFVQIGEATDGSGVEFDGNSAFGLGFSVGYQF